jgi:hypothetical protein
MTDKHLISEMTIEELDSRIREIAFEMVSEKNKKLEPRLDPAEIRAAVRADQLRTYERARRYWRENNQPERAALSDEELDAQFWLFDNDAIPRLKEEQGTVEIQPSSLMLMLQALRADPDWKAEEDRVYRELGMESPSDKLPEVMATLVSKRSET